MQKSKSAPHRGRIHLGSATTGAEFLFGSLSQRYKHGSILEITNLPFDEWTKVFGSERLTDALLHRLTHHVHSLELNGDSYRHAEARKKRAPDTGRAG